MVKLLTKIFGTKHERDMKYIQPVIDKINNLETGLKQKSDDELKAMTPALKQRLANGESLDDILPEAFATCREASRRVLGMRHYDVQLIGGYVLHKGSIAEMRTGEGKTLVATLPLYLNALSGKGAHLVTVNDYLAKRDAEWMGRVYNFLGLSVGIIHHNMSDRERQVAYGSDITYATNNELGFDYLRDNMKFRLENYVQRDLNFAIVDECDSILVDEARTPLIISGPTDHQPEIYIQINKVAQKLQPTVHFTMEEKNRSVALTEDGNAQLEKLLGIENVYDPQNIDVLHNVYQALKAIYLFKRDVDYMVKDDEIVIVDEFTGRLMDGRRWSDGLHQAVEAKEGVAVKSENQTLASITFQNYFRMYNKISGMTGTADTEAAEFKKIYNLDVMVIPTNKPIQRKDHDDIVYKNEAAKFRAISNDILERRKKFQPVLVGTVSIEKSEMISDYLKKLNIPHNVLNAKHHEREAEIVAQAGRKGAITIATNMAGRGTDIVLGGNPEFLAKAEAPTDEEKYKQALEKYKLQCEQEKQDVLNAGGLYIVGTERHESRRIDNQLRGRAGRQGDPGESRFYLSLGDDLMRKFNGERIQKIMDTLKVPEDEPITARMVTRSIEGAQRKVEGHNFDLRKHLIEYDDVMNKQRQTIYSWRRSLLSGKDEAETIEKNIKEMMSDVASNILDTYAHDQTKREQWDLAGMRVAVEKQFGIDLDIPANVLSEDLTHLLSNAVKDRFEKQRAHLGHLFPEVQKSLLLGAIDHYWKEHLHRVDRIRDGVNLRAYAQKDTLLEYKKESYMAFQEMQQFIKSDCVEKLMKVQLVQREGQETSAQAEEEILEALRPEEPQEMYLSSGEPEEKEENSQLSRSERRKETKQKKKKKLF